MENYCNSCNECMQETEKDEFFEFAEDVACSYVEMWNAKYAGAFVDSNGNNVFIKKVIYANPKVIICWNDGTKSSASCILGDTYNLEAGLNIAINNRLYGHDEMERLYDDWLPEIVDDLNTTYEVSIADVRKKYKTMYKAFEKVCQKNVEADMKSYLESCGYKVEKKNK